MIFMWLYFVGGEFDKVFLMAEVRYQWLLCDGADVCDSGSTSYDAATFCRPLQIKCLPVWTTSRRNV